jgi:ankyrin repeat protein
MPLLLKHGVSVNVTLSDGYTPLLKSVQFGCEPVVSALLQAGSDINYQTPTGTNVLFLCNSAQPTSFLWYFLLTN